MKFRVIFTPIPFQVGLRYVLYVQDWFRNV